MAEFLLGPLARWCWVRWYQALVLWVLFSVSGLVAAQGFDHLKTGFPLNGRHANTKCESCHVAGVFKGTPKDCESCHTSGARMAVGNTLKPSNHIPTNASCATCHTSTTFTGARMDHSTVSSGSCATCHNGIISTGKPNGHMATTASCDSCHKTTGWLPASKFNHEGVAAGSCASCHNGQRATGKSSTHVPYQSVGSIGNASCDTCHKAGFTSWTPARLHASVTVTAQCAACHAGIKPNTTIHTGQTTCENCHRSTTSWAAGKVDHATFNAATNCSSCHNGAAATGKPAVHIPVGGTNCFSCHNTAGWRPTKWNHTQVTVANQCGTCHTGSFPPADGKSSTHVSYQSVGSIGNASCDTCHKAGYTSWTPARLHSSVTVTAQCATCHSGLKPSTPIHTGQTTCENCHRSTTSWAAGKVDHSTFNAATNCSSCHNGAAATGKPAMHIPVGGTNCFACHNTSGWKPTKWSHTQVTVTNQCGTCHTGSFPPADGKPTTHVPYQAVGSIGNASCDTCHKAGFTSWTPARLHSSVTVTAQCATCHASIKPNTTIHTGQTTCENCHRSTTSWNTAKVDHTTFNAATNCSSCHNGSAATGKPAVHIPVGGTNCFSCHNTTGWRPTKWNHTQVTVTNHCGTCHTGGFPPADGKPTNHVPYQLVAGLGAASCDTCHKAGFTSWTPARLHASVTVTAQCATCHASTKPNTAIHIGQTTCENCHRSTTSWNTAKVDHTTFNAATNCSSCHNGSAATGKPAVHIPVGGTNCFSCHNTTGWRPTKWNHTQVPVVNQCGSCHSGSFPPADGKPANHLPYQLVAGLGATDCGTCHKGGYTSWAGARVHANVAINGQCKTCHSGTYVAQGATAKPSNHIPEAQLLNGSAMECNACHNSTTAWTQRMNHNGSLGNGSGWCKNCHQTGVTYLGNMEKKALTHDKKTGVTDCSQSGCHRPLGTKGTPYTKWN